MAKGLRASVKKTNKSRLRSKVFGPAEAARLDRLSAKLLEIVNEPQAKTPDDESMDVELTKMETEQARQITSDVGPAADVDMDLDENMESPAAPLKSRKKQSPGRVQKKGRGRGKARNQLVFPTIRNKGRGKGPGFTNKRQRSS